MTRDQLMSVSAMFSKLTRGWPVGLNSSRESDAALRQSGSVVPRREFCSLAGVTLLLIPAGLFLVRCGGSGGDATGNGPANQPSLNGTKLIYTSSIVGDHSHTFGIEMGAIDVPPANGVSGPSSVV